LGLSGELEREEFEEEWIGELLLLLHFLLRERGLGEDVIQLTGSACVGGIF
jgi:hypothetical protein